MKKETSKSGIRPMFWVGLTGLVVVTASLLGSVLRPPTATPDPVAEEPSVASPGSTPRQSISSALAANSGQPVPRAGTASPRSVTESGSPGTAAQPAARASAAFNPSRSTAAAVASPGNRTATGNPQGSPPSPSASAGTADPMGMIAIGEARAVAGRLPMEEPTNGVMRYRNSDRVRGAMVEELRKVRLAAINEARKTESQGQEASQPPKP